MINFSFGSFILVASSTIYSIYILKRMKNIYLKVLSYFVLIGFLFYSGFGLFIYEIEDRLLYSIQYCLSIISFSITMILCQAKHTKHIERKKNIDEKYVKSNKYVFTRIFSLIYIITFFIPLLYPTNRLADIFKPSLLIEKYSAVRSSTNVELKSDSIYYVTTNFIRTLCLPYFYIYLYSIRKKSAQVISIYIFVAYLDAINLNYISRNEIIVILGFIFLYLYTEKILPKKFLITALFISIPFVIITLNVLKYARNSLDFNTSFIISLSDIFLSETNFVLNYNRASLLSDSISPIQYYIYVLTCFIPSFIRNRFGIYTINLQEIHSNTLLNLKYGEESYYIILTSVLGEGIIVFNKYFAWIYMIIFALILNWFAERINRNDCMSLLFIYFILDILRDMRGGSQFIITRWGSSFVPLLIISYLFRQLIVKRYKIKK